MLKIKRGISVAILIAAAYAFQLSASAPDLIPTYFIDNTGYPQYFEVSKGIMQGAPNFNVVTNIGQTIYPNMTTTIAGRQAWVFPLPPQPNLQVKAVHNNFSASGLSAPQGVGPVQIQDSSWVTPMANTIYFVSVASPAPGQNQFVITPTPMTRSL